MGVTIRLQSSLLLVFLFLHLCDSTFIKSHHYYQHRSPENRHVSVFVFGDSYFDPGNNNYINTTTLDQANFSPYGQTFFRYPTGRFSDGRLISDFVAEFAKLPLIRPFLQPGFSRYNDGVNFASAGAGCLTETFRGSVIDLQTQIKYFMRVKRVVSQVQLSKAVYLFSIGANDYLTLFLTNSTMLNNYSKSHYIGMVIGNLTTVIKEIHKIGGRKFGFLNLPQIGCFPGIIINNNGSCLKEASSLIKLHNKALSQTLIKLRQELDGFKYSLFDLNTNLRHRINHPSKYGFKEGKTACCGTGKYRGVFSCGGKRIVKEFEVCDNPNQHVFWDSYHLTETAYKQLADQMWEGTQNQSHSVCPYSLKDLFNITNY